MLKLVRYKFPYIVLMAYFLFSFGEDIIVDYLC